MRERPQFARALADSLMCAQEVLSASEDRPVIVDWFTDFCGPCKLIEPLLAELAERGEVRVVKAKPQETLAFRKWCEKQGRRFHVAALPTVILFEKGMPIRSLIGRFTQEKLESFVGLPQSEYSAIPVPVTTDPQPWEGRVAPAVPPPL